MKRIIALVYVIIISTLWAAPTATVKVTSAEFGKKWPFLVSGGVIGYEPLLVGRQKLALLTFESGGKTYALNGLAKGRSKERGYLDIVAIWKDDPEIPGVKMDISPITQRGLKLENAR